MLFCVPKRRGSGTQTDDAVWGSVPSVPMGDQHGPKEGADRTVEVGHDEDEESQLQGAMETQIEGREESSGHSGCLDGAGSCNS